MSVSSRFMWWLPKGTPAENLEWRKEARTKAIEDARIRWALRSAAFEDVLFWFNAFCWLYEPRAQQKIIPFVTWPHQDPAIVTADEAIDEAEATQRPTDVVWDKSRTQGATYMFLNIFLRRWLRDPMFSAGLVTRSEDQVDSASSPGALLWKVNWAIEHLPWWMRPRGWSKGCRSLSDHTILNPDHGATFKGFAATVDVASGDRFTVFGFDEVAKFPHKDAEAAAASTQHVTYCRQFISTHKGDSGLFYRLVTEDTSARKIVLAWEDNPSQNRLMYRWTAGMYVAENGSLQRELDLYIKKHKPDIEKLHRRGFMKEGRRRSPHYDAECLRGGATPRSIAEEMDRDPRGTVGKLFNTTVLDLMMKEKAKPPVWEGVPTIHNGELRLTYREGGLLKLWFKPGLDDAPPRGKFVIGADPAAGVGGEDAGNACLVGCNAETGEQVLEYADPLMPETRLARLAAALGYWLDTALLIWEATGPFGKRFRNEVIKELAYPRIWMGEREDVRSRQRVAKAGWSNNQVTGKADLFEDLWLAWDEGLCTPRSAELLRECNGWEWDDSSRKVVRTDGQKRIIYTGDSGHGDRAIAMGLCWKAMKETVRNPLDKPDEIAQDAPYGTMAWRINRQRALENRVSSDETGEGVGLADLAGGRQQWTDADY